MPDIKIEFNLNNVPEETKVNVMGCLQSNSVFGLQNPKGKTYIFIPAKNAIYFDERNQQICPDRKAFENVISMSLFRFRTFIPLTTLKLPTSLQLCN